jgi:hypothetical protein
MRQRFYKINSLKPWVLCLLLAAASPQALQAQCTPTSAVICANGDDLMSVWVNNYGPINFTYCYYTNNCSPQCFSLPVSILSQTQNFVAAQITNTSPTESYGTYLLDMTCSGGTHSYTTNADGNTTLYYDPAGNNPPTNDGGGLSWTDPNYSYGVTWGPAASVTAFVHGKLLLDPLTGTYIPPTADNAQAYAPNGTEVTYLRQSFPITVTYPPPADPVFTVTQTILSQSSGVSTQAVTYVDTICNTGGFTANPVTLTENLDSDLNYDGPYGPQGALELTGSNQMGQFDFPATLWSNGECQSVTFYAINYSFNSAENCRVAVNSGTVSFTANAGVTNNSFTGSPVTFTCPGTPTFTPTPTTSSTYTPTKTPTPTFTPLFTYTWTLSPTVTLTPTITLSPTPTLSPTQTYTKTQTLTPTESFTPTRTYTVTLTPTVTNTPTVTLSPTITNTPGPLVFYISKNVITSPASPVSIYVSYQIPGNYGMKIYNSAGEFIVDLAHSNYDPTQLSHSFSWDGTNYLGQKCASGIYLIYYLQPRQVSEAKILLLR